ncbi:AAA family ATPase [Salinibaculum rarum]|uniref:AAA family ATPase n=1 Tax=Salinibaculum rarum TaxID=3058903 RepID=UPI00265F7BF1|nr:AAA family ATPase [Salinibaculum sp. KK48]
MTRTLALVGAAGGAGTTRLAVEIGATLTRTGRDVAVVDAAYETQGLADYVETIDADVTALVTDDAQLDSVVQPAGLETPGQLSLYPARAPFERLARAKTAGAAERLEKQIAAIALSHDVVVVDTPPVATNQAVAAVNAADRIVAVTPDSARGEDALARLSGRLQDVGESLDAVLANFTDEEAVVTDADARVPVAETTAPARCPSCLDTETAFAPAVADAAEAALDVTLSLEFESSGRLDGLLG